MEKTQKLRILMIEDEEPERNRFQEYCASQPDVEAVWCVESVAEGLAVLREQSPAFVVLDLMLRGENGDRFLEEVRKMGNARPQIFIVSNITSGRTKQVMGSTGLVEYYYEKSAEGFGPAYLLQEMRRFTGGLFQRAETARRLSALRASDAETAAESAPVPARFTPDTLHTAIADILEEFGIASGSACQLATVETLYQVILLASQKGAGRVVLERHVYPLVMEAIPGCGLDAIRHNLRGAVLDIYDDGTSRELIRQYCPYPGKAQVGHPYVKTFLFSFARAFLKNNKSRFPLEI